MPNNSAVWGLLVCALWLFYFYGANLTAPWFGLFSFDSSELPIVTLYAMYIPIFVMFVKIYDGGHPFRKYVAPILSIIGCVFMVFSAFYAHGKAVWFYLIVFAVIMLIGRAIYKGKK